MKNRLELIHEMAELATNEADLTTLTQMYYDDKYGYFESMSYEDLLSEAEQMNIDIDDVVEPKRHPHSIVMGIYAEDALGTKEPWKLWEVKHKEETTWCNLYDHPRWSDGCEYRRKDVKADAQLARINLLVKKVSILTALLGSLDEDGKGGYVLHKCHASIIERARVLYDTYIEE